MKRIVGILVIVLVLYGYMLLRAPQARTVQNHQRIAERLAMYGVMTLGVGVLIISGGIDLSIGSVVALSAVGLGLMLTKRVPETLAGFFPFTYRARPEVEKATFKFHLDLASTYFGMPMFSALLGVWAARALRWCRQWGLCTRGIWH